MVPLWENWGWEWRGRGDCNVLMITQFIGAREKIQSGLFGSKAHVF